MGLFAPSVGLFALQGYLLSGGNWGKRGWKKGVLSVYNRINL
jgi:hypothetical protein